MGASIPRESFDKRPTSGRLRQEEQAACPHHMLAPLARVFAVEWDCETDDRRPDAPEPAITAAPAARRFDITT
jgi:hypothetical protein